MGKEEKKYILGIDTSNYTTSVAIIDNQFKIIADKRKAITVNKGMKGIRQSEALFQHLENLPDLLDNLLSEYGSKLSAICVSDRPRPVEGSYMPVFKAGINFGRVISDSLNIPLFYTSHQESHVEAGKYQTPLFNEDNGKVTGIFHLSGGTTEILLDNKIVGGSKDISMGQLIDRMGVKSGVSFPAGKELDKLALAGLKEYGSYENIKKHVNKTFKPISKNGLKINLSGLDSQLDRIIESDSYNTDISELSAQVFYLISQCLQALTKDLKKQYNILSVLFVGGVSSSKFIRNYLLEESNNDQVNIHFGKPELSTDNAVGTAIKGGRIIWR